MKRLLILLPLILFVGCGGTPTRSDRPEQEAHSQAAAPAPIDQIELSADEAPAGTLLRLELLDPLSSRTAKIGDTFKLRTATELVRDGVVLLPARLPAYGEVIHADKRGLSGKPGELLVKLRGMEWQGQMVRIRNATNAAGKNHTTAAIVTAQLFGLLGIFITGGEAEIARGSVVFGELPEALSLPAATP